MTAAKPPMDAFAVTLALRKHYDGDAWVCLEEVPDDLARRAQIADFIAFGLWHSHGNDIHGHEIKVSRSDWLRERKQPAKSAPMFLFFDFFWLVVPEGSEVYKIDEVPMPWGIMHVNGNGCKVIRKAPRQERQATLPRRFIASMLRRAKQQCESKSLLQQEYERGRHDEKNVTNNEPEKLALARLTEKVRKFSEQTGVSILDTWRYGDVAEAVRLVGLTHSHRSPVDDLEITINRQSGELEDMRKLLADIKARRERVEAGPVLIAVVEKRHCLCCGEEVAQGNVGVSIPKYVDIVLCRRCRDAAMAVATPRNDGEGSGTTAAELSGTDGSA